MGFLVDSVTESNSLQGGQPAGDARWLCLFFTKQERPEGRSAYKGISIDMRYKLNYSVGNSFAADTAFSEAFTASFAAVTALFAASRASDASLAALINPESLSPISSVIS